MALSAPSFFSSSYEEARSGFLAAAMAADVALESYATDAKGPGGLDLTCDTAWLGPRDATRVMVVLSATHGVEGFCGSGIQQGLLRTGAYQELPPGMAMLLIHAINPYGFAWQRRATQENVDLNRNFIDFSEPAPDNPGYRRLAAAFCPEKWDPVSRVQNEARLLAYGQVHGDMVLQAALSSGQYWDEKGLFFGGKGPTWSRRTLETIFQKELSEAKMLAAIDCHTGLGPRGYGERICGHPAGTKAFDRLNRWFSGDMTSTDLGTSSSAKLSGTNKQGMVRAAPSVKQSHVTLEFGTQPMELVSMALRAENWLHHHGDRNSSLGQEITTQIRAAFYQESDDWKSAVFERALETFQLMSKGLAEEG